MALADAYATPADYRARISPDRDNGDDVSIAADLQAVSRYIDHKLGRCFNVTPTAVVRVFEITRDGQVTLDIDDLAAVPAAGKITIDADLDGVYEVTLTSTNVECLPRNAPTRPEPEPYTRLALMPRATQSFGGIGSRVRIEGLWGWPAVPGAIPVQTIMLTAILRVESPYATRRVPEGMDMAIEMSPDATFLLRRLVETYARPWVAV